MPIRPSSHAHLPAARAALARFLSPVHCAGSTKEEPKDIENGGGENGGEGEADKGADGVPNPNKDDTATAAPVKTPDGKEEQVDFKTLTAERPSKSSTCVATTSLSGHNISLLPPNCPSGCRTTCAAA